MCAGLSRKCQVGSGQPFIVARGRLKLQGESLGGGGLQERDQRPYIRETMHSALNL